MGKYLFERRLNLFDAIAMMIIAIIVTPLPWWGALPLIAVLAVVMASISRFFEGVFVSDLHAD